MEQFHIRFRGGYSVAARGGECEQGHRPHPRVSSLTLEGPPVREEELGLGGPPVTTGVAPVSWILLASEKEFTMPRSHAPYLLECRRRMVESVRSGRTPEERRAAPATATRWLAATVRTVRRLAGARARRAVRAVGCRGRARREVPAGFDGSAGDRLRREAGRRPRNPPWSPPPTAESGRSKGLKCCARCAACDARYFSGAALPVKARDSWMR